MALLYFGPLLAGLGGFGWSVVPVFAAIFLLWLVIMRPADWPRSLADWGRPEAAIGFLTKLLVQVLLVTVCFGIGRGIGGVMGFNPSMPGMLPIGLSFLSVPLARLIWNPDQDAALDGFLDEALEQMPVTAARSATAASREDRTERQLLAARLTQPLADLPDSTTPARLQDHLSALGNHMAADELLDVLHQRVGAPAPTRAERLAFILQATDPRVAEICRGQAAPVKALQVAGQDMAALELLARRCVALLEQDADAWGDCPNDGALRSARAKVDMDADASVAAALDDLLALNARLAPLT